ncbi:MAG: sensor domain-containing diguanylate cyclase [Acidimicrobiales bacterium]
MIGRDDDPELLAALLDHSPYVVMRVDGEGTIGWVNASIERLFGLPVASVIGTNILTYLDLTWDPEALASIGDALGAEGMRLPTLFRSNLPDGTSPIFEVWANAQLHDPAIEGLVVYVRRWDERMLLDAALESSAVDAPLVDTLDLLAQSMATETLEARGAIMLDLDDDGRPGTVVGHGLDDVRRRAVRPGPVVRRRAPGRTPDRATGGTGLAGSACWCWPVRDDDVPIGCVVALRDDPELEIDHSRREAMRRIARIAAVAAARAASHASLHHAATHDALTGLANRARFWDELDAITSAARHPGGKAADGTAPSAAEASSTMAVLYLDLDGFKDVNDRLGHAAGDAVLVEVARRLQATVRRSDLVARLGGDEFAVLCERVADLDELEALASRLQAAITEPVVLDGEAVAIGASIGIAARPAGACSPDDLVEAADAALYRVKFGAKGGWLVSTGR